MSVNSVEKHRRITPVNALGQLQSEQANKLITLGFNKELGMTEDTYLKTLPGFLEQPTGELWDFPLLVDPRVGLLRQGQMNGVEVKNDETNKYIDVVNAPLKPYTAWFRMRHFHFDIERYFRCREETTIESALGSISNSELPGTISELMSVRMHFPRLIIRTRVIFAAGSRSRNDMFIPGFGYNDPFLHNAEPDRAWPDFSHDIGYFLLLRNKRINTELK